MIRLPDAVDVLVIGAGPAGGAAALAAARREQAVVLADRGNFPREKVCGCCLSAAALAELHGMGLANLPRRRGAAVIYRLALRRQVPRCCARNSTMRWSTQPSVPGRSSHRRRK
jgi:2-polyprenyl-6-methoxyphenol hydroxylase-like FAD-dependent oxidoreductase